LRRLLLVRRRVYVVEGGESGRSMAWDWLRVLRRRGSMYTRWCLQLDIVGDRRCALLAG
jgi:hypothetical protein